MVECAFKSQHPSVLEWMAAANTRQRTWSETMNRLRERFPGYQVMVRHSTWSTRLIGLAGPGAPEGEGWRFDKKVTAWVPDRRTTAGKTLADDFDASHLKLPPLPGMPDTVVVGNKWHHPGVTEYEGIVWVTWGCDAESINGDWSRQSLDPDVWQQAPLSEFYRAKEAVA